MICSGIIKKCTGNQYLLFHMRPEVDSYNIQFNARSEKQKIIQSVQEEILVRLGQNINLLFIKINTHKSSKVLLV